MKAKKICITFLYLSLLLGGLVYVALASFSEHREYKKASIDYWVLTPKEISSIAKFCNNDPNFIYSAADGVKPMAVQLKCTATSGKVVGYFEREGFAKTDAGIYKKDKKEIELTRNEVGSVTMTTLLLFL
jgi:hypothetical protein